MSEASAVEALLFAALDKPTADERAAFLDSACGSDAELRRQVDKLLQAHANVGNFLQKPVVEQLAVTPELADATQELAGSTDGPGAVRPGGTGVYLERTEGGAASDRGALDFLEPSSRPDSLGRLGHYEVLEVLGQGGFGIVYRAFDEALQRVVAIKVLSSEMAATTSARKRFLREARSSARVRHDNVVEVYAVEEQPLPYLVMEFVPGETLQQRCDRTGPMAVTDVVRIGRQIAEGLAAAHARGLIHRDIKPGNILIEAGPNEPVKITDFGLARATDDVSLSQSGTIAGTPMYMAPEQASAGRLDHRADLFSLGSVLYTMTTGRPPFRAPSTLAVLRRVAEDTPQPIREIIPGTPAWLCDLIAKLHAKKPDDRFATAREVADLLGRGLAVPQSAGIVQPPAVAVPTVVPRTPSQKTREATPTVKPRSSLRRWLVTAAVMLTLLGGLTLTEATGLTHVRSTVIRLFSPDGTLVVEVDDPDVSVQIDGSDIIIRGAGVKEIRLKPGSYTVKGLKDGQVVSRELVNITRDGKQVVRVSQEARPDDNKGIVAEATYPDRRAAEYVLSVGGSVKLNGQKKEFPAVTELPRESFRVTGVKFWNADGNRVSVTDEGLSVFKDCKNVTEIATFRTKLGAAGLANFKGCTNLTVLSLEQSAVTDEELATFKDFKDLTYVKLNGSRVTDAGLVHFKDCKNFTHLYLHGAQVSDAGLTHLTAMEKLTELDLRKTQVTAKGVERLAKALPQCKITWDGGAIEPAVNLDPDRRAAEYVLSLGGMVKVNGQNLEIRAAAGLPRDSFRLTVIDLHENLKATDAGLAGFKDCEHVTYLGLWNCPSITDAGLAHFSGCRNITQLHLQGTNVTDAGLARFKGSAIITQLYLSGPRITDAGLAHFKDCKDLTYLSLQRTRVTDGGLALFKDCKKLHFLSLSKTMTSDTGLALFQDCQRLKFVNVQATNVTAAGINELKGALPSCKITWDGGVIEPRVSFAPLPDADVQRIAALPAAQVEEIRAELMRLNPDFRGRLIPTIKDGVVTGLKSQDGMRSIADLSPLRGMKLTVLVLTNHSQVSDLTPLRGMPLEHLSLWPFLGSDLTPLQGMPLKILNIGGGGQKLDLTPLAGLPLEFLCVNGSQVSDLTPLKDMPLKHVEFTNTNVTDVEPLRNIKSLETINKVPVAEFWKSVAPRP